MSILSVFIEGLLSFFSPCVLPLIPVYIGYLSGGTLKKAEDGTMTYDRKKVIINTIFFVIGISMAFFVLGFGISAVGRFFSGNQLIFARVGGIIVVLFGLYQLGFLGTNRILSGDYRLPVQFEKMTMSPITAILMGFVISFAWTPCIGPVLSSVLIMSATAGSAANGFGLIAVYTLGYIIPFVLVGFFTNTLLGFFSKHRGVVQYTVKIGGALLIVMGVLMFTGKMNSITSYLSAFSSNDVVTESTEENSNDADKTTQQSDESSDESKLDDEKMAAYDFTLTDQYGNSHTLSDYKGKIVFLNFWATWCPPCRAELPDIQSLYEDYLKMENPDVVILGVAFPAYGNEKSVEGITQFLNENGVTYPVLMDTEASLIMPYYITAYPTTFMIDPNGNILGYIPGGMTKDIMENVIDQAREASDYEQPEETELPEEEKMDETKEMNSQDFYALEFDENSDIFARIKGKSYKDNCTVPLSDLRYLHVKHIGFDGQPHDGEIICNKYIAEDLLEIFEALYEAKYPIEKIRLVDEYNADDESSMADNNSSSFNFRFISYTTKISKHGYGLAMDINTLYNPYVKTVDGKLSIEPANAEAYVDRSQDFPHKIDENDLAYKLFTEHGFQWGGAWKNSKDYQHFEVPDSVVKKLYN